MKVTVNYNGIDFEVTGDFIAGYEGKMYMGNGDPGCPPEPAYFDNLDILHCGESVYEVLSERAIENIENLAVTEAQIGR